jgi:hypothetical protein
VEGVAGYRRLRLVWTGVAANRRIRVVCGGGCRRFMRVRVAGGRSGTWGGFLGVSVRVVHRVGCRTTQGVTVVHVGGCKG